MGEKHKQYLAAKYGSGVGVNLTEQGGHRVVDSVLNAYATAGQQLPASLDGAVNELRDIARSEFDIRNASPRARQLLVKTGQYDPLNTGRRERELVNMLLDTSRGVVSEPDRLVREKARAELQFTKTKADEAAGTLQDRMTLVKQQVRMGEQALVSSKLQTETAKLQSELAQITAQSQIAAATRAEQAVTVGERLANVPVFDMLDVVQSGNPMLATELFGEDVSRDVQLEVLTNRLNKEAQVLEAAGTRGSGVRARAGAAGSGGANDLLRLSALEMQRVDNIISTMGDDLPAIVSGKLPLPQSSTMANIQSARNVQIQRQHDQDRLTIDMMNNKLNIDGTPLGPKGAAGQREDKIETGARIMFTLPTQELQQMHAQVQQGQGVVMQVPNMDATLTLDNRQAAEALQLWDNRQSALAQQNMVRSTQRQAVQVFSNNMSQLESRIRTAGHGAIPQVVQQALAQEHVALAEAYGTGSTTDIAGATSRIEEAMRKAQMSEESIATIIHNKFQSDEQVAVGTLNMLSRSPDRQLFTQVTNAFLAQVEHRAASSTSLGGSIKYPLTPDKLAEMHSIMINPDIDPVESGKLLGDLLGYPVSDLRKMMQSSLISANFNAGFAVFIQNMATSTEQGGTGALDTETANDLLVNVQEAVRTRLELGESLSVDDYIGTVQTIASAFVPDSEDRKAVMGTFYEALRSVDGSTLFRRADGTTHPDELALFSFVNNITNPSTPVSGAGSVALDELPEVLGAQLEDQVDRSVLGHQRFETPSTQERMVAGAVHTLLGTGLYEDDRLGRPLYGPTSASGEEAPEGYTERVRDHYKLLGPQRIRETLNYNPALTQFVTGKIVQQLLSVPDRKPAWYDFVMPSFVQDFGTNAAHYKAIDIEGLREEALEAGILTRR